MSKNEKRKHARIDSIHLLNYVYYDENGKETTQGMGRTLNVSESGILLETHSELDLHKEVSLGIGIEEDTVDIQGKIVFNKKTEAGKFESGIQFINTPEGSKDVLQRFISAFNAAKGSHNNKYSGSD